MKDERTFGYNIKKDKEKIEKLRLWNTCSFCGRKAEVRPHAPLDGSYLSWKIYPMRLCFYCAEIQHDIREMIEKVENPDGN